MPTDAEEPQLDLLAAHWQWSLDAEARALDAGSALLGPSRIAHERRWLADERQKALALLRLDAAMRRIEPPPLLSPRQVTPEMLGLPAATKACVFDLDGVLTESGALHAAVWAETFDPLLLEIAQAAGRAFVPFDRITEYRTCLDGRSRVEGIELFLAARGLRLPSGRQADAGGATVAGLARRKGELLERALRSHRLAALEGARRYLQAAALARVGTAVVSASTTTLPMLRLAALAHLVQVRADAETMQREGLRSRPAPDLLLAACRDLAVRPDEVVSLTHSGAGVVAARNLGMTVIGVASDAGAGPLRDFGAPLVVPALSALLDPSLRVDSLSA